MCRAGIALQFRVDGRVPLLDPVGYGQSQSKRYVAGSSVEYQFMGGFAVEAGFLYRRAASSAIFFSGVNLLAPPESARLIDFRNRINLFEAPILGKYYFRRDERWQPFVSTGYSFRKTLTEGEATVLSEINGAQETRTDRSSSWQRLEIGAAVSAGVRWKKERFSFVPELRYTRWSTSNVYLRKDQLDFLFGIRF